MKMHYSHRLSASQKEKIVGLFIIIPLAILLIVFLFIGRTKHFFEEKYKIKAVFKEGEGLKAGIPIILSGIDIGAIKSAQLNEENKVEVTLEIRKMYQNKIRTDSKATVAKAGFIGEQRIKIFPGSPSLPVISDGGSITVEEGMAIEDIVNRVRPALENVEKTLNKIAEIAGNIPSTAASDILGNTKSITDNIKIITEDIKKGRGTAGAILTERDLYNNINETVKKADNAMQKINDILVKVDNTSGHLPEITQSIKKELPPILEDIRGTLKNVKESSSELPAILDLTQKTLKKIEEISARLPAIMENIEKTTANIKEASGETPAIASSARESAEDANSIIKGAKNSWPIKNFVEEEKETKIPTGERAQNE
jgi:phospholipid/cholesterol/gamma-HCH transport system substrate-binding protein